MAEDLVLVNRPCSGVSILTLNRPDKRNALSIALRDQGSDTLDRLGGDESVKAVVITGSGETFCAGFDLKEFEQTSDPEFAHRLWASSDRWHRTLAQFPLPLVGAVNGPALAGGFDLAVLCDIRVIADTARFAHPEISFGDLVYGPLHDLVGGAVARDLCLTGRTIDSAEAFKLGLASQVVPKDEVLNAAVAVASTIARAPRGVLVRTKSKAIRRAGVSGTTLDL